MLHGIGDYLKASKETKSPNLPELLNLILSNPPRPESNNNDGCISK